MKHLVYFLTLFLFLGSSCSDDDPQVITETVTVRDTIVVTQHDTTVVIQVDTSIIIVRDTTVIVQIDTIINTISDDSSVVVICVRHAETVGGANPSLSTDGMKRAADLSHALSNTNLAAVYSSNFNRTRQTAAVSAMDQGLNVITYDAFNIPAFASDLLQQHKGETALAVGHSNTTPQLINALTSTTNYATFDETTYDNLFIVKVKINGEATVYHLEYGMDTP